MTESGNRGRQDRSGDMNIIAYLPGQVGMHLPKKAHTMLPSAESHVLITQWHRGRPGGLVFRLLCGARVHPHTGPESVAPKYIHTNSYLEARE